MSSNPGGYVSRLAGDMHKFPPEHYISGNSTLSVYDESVIKKFLSYLNPDNFRLVIVAPSFTPDQDAGWQEGKHDYATPFHQSPISPEFIARLKAGNRKDSESDELQLPNQNEFVPDNYDLVVAPKESKKLPEMILDEETIRVWHCLGTRFKVPKVVLRIDIKR